MKLPTYLAIAAILCLSAAVLRVEAIAKWVAQIRPEELDEQFEMFKRDYARTYSSADEEDLRKSIFHANLELIYRHNYEQEQFDTHRFRLGVNQFADMTNDEFRAKVIRQWPMPSRQQVTVEHHQRSTNKSLPDSVDWVAKGAVTPVMNQGQCGSSWAIPVVGAVEGAHAIATGSLVALSVQQMIDCCAPDGDYGCSGGEFDSGYQCIIRLGGLDTASSYPYNGDGNEQCQFSARNVGATIASYKDVTANDEAALEDAVANLGPMAAAVDASQPSFQLYASGVYSDPRCSSTNVDHGVTVVGYGALDSVQYWKVKNSWGTDWGMGGYILIARNDHNMCGIANMASYPIV